MKNKISLARLAKIFIPLLLICVCVAGMVSGVYVLTAAKIAENEAGVLRLTEQRKLDTIADIYGAGVDFTLLDDAAVSDMGADEIRTAEADGKKYCCVTLTVKGYRDGLQLFVAFDSDGSVLRVLVLASNETTGIGSKVADSEYLEKYNGLYGELTLGTEVDKIAGASISSKAVLSGVNAATRIVNELGLVGEVTQE